MATNNYNRFLTMKNADIFDDFSLSTFLDFRHKCLIICIRKFFIIVLGKKKKSFSEPLHYGRS